MGKQRAPASAPTSEPNSDRTIGTPESASEGVALAPVAASGPELWTSDALLLLGRVDGHWTEARPCAEGVAPLSRDWNVLDAWGRVVGHARGGVFAGRHQMRVTRGQPGARIYSTGAGFSSAEWRLAPEEAEGARRSVLDVIAPMHFPADAELLFFRGTQQPSAASAPRAQSPTGFALAIGPAALAVLRSSSLSDWSVVYDTQSPGDWPSYAARTIVDLDRDGTPEVIYHFNEYADGPGHEVVLRSADAGASWAEVGNNADDCP